MSFSCGPNSTSKKAKYTKKQNKTKQKYKHPDTSVIKSFKTSSYIMLRLYSVAVIFCSLN